MDVKQITERLNRGVVYEGMAQDLENLLTSGDITQAEYDALSKKIGEITSSFKEVVIEEAKGESNEIEVSELTSEEPEGKVLEDLFATNPTATGASEDKDAAGSDSADESKEENEDPTPEPQETTSENKNESDTQEEPANNSVAQWVSDYHDYLYEWSARNPERRIKDFESKDNSIKATFKDGVALNFSSPSNVAVKAADPSSPKASDFDALLEVLFLRLIIFFKPAIYFFTIIFNF